jgi:hypothetical protein
MVTRSSAQAPPLGSAVLSNRRASHTAHRGGQHVTSCTTLERLAAALEVKLVARIETEAGDRELVAISEALRRWRVQSITEHPTLAWIERG